MKKSKTDFKQINKSLNDLKDKIDNMTDDELIIFYNHCMSNPNFRIMLSKFPNIGRKVGLLNGKRD